MSEWVRLYTFNLLEVYDFSPQHLNATERIQQQRLGILILHCIHLQDAYNSPSKLHFSLRKQIFVRIAKTLEP